MNEQDLIDWLQDRKEIPGLEEINQATDVILAGTFSLRQLMHAVSARNYNSEKMDEVIFVIAMLVEPECLAEQSMTQEDYDAFVRENIELFKGADRRVGLTPEFCWKYLEPVEATKQPWKSSWLSAIRSLFRR